MIPVVQTELGGRKKPGNCLSACVASILEIKLATVPHFVLNPKWLMACNEFLLKYNLQMVRISGTLATIELPGYYIVTGPTKNGCCHAVVGFYGNIVHDPHPQQPGICHVDNYFFFIALDASKHNIYDNSPKNEIHRHPKASGNRDKTKRNTTRKVPK